jgi:hypothetical protein
MRLQQSSAPVQFVVSLLTAMQQRHCDGSKCWPPVQVEPTHVPPQLVVPAGHVPSGGEVSFACRALCCLAFLTHFLRLPRSSIFLHFLRESWA